MNKKFVWKAIDEYHNKHTGTLLTDSTLLDEIETKLFKELDELPVPLCFVALRLFYSDGSGAVWHYEKRGNVWKLKYSDNIMPNWFPWFFLAMLVALVAVLFVITS